VAKLTSVAAKIYNTYKPYLIDVTDFVLQYNDLIDLDQLAGPSLGDGLREGDERMIIRKSRSLDFRFGEDNDKILKDAIHEMLSIAIHAVRRDLRFNPTPPAKYIATLFWESDHWDIQYKCEIYRRENA
jgi:hypothetical protein